MFYFFFFSYRQNKSGLSLNLLPGHRNRISSKTSRRKHDCLTAQILRGSNGACWAGPVGHLQPQSPSHAERQSEEKEGGQHGSWSGKEECDWHVFNTGWQEEAEGMNRAGGGGGGGRGGD